MPGMTPSQSVTLLSGIPSASCHSLLLPRHSRHQSRETNGEALIWGKKPTMIEAKYKTADGSTKTSLLLTAGWCATLPARALSRTALAAICMARAKNNVPCCLSRSGMNSKMDGASCGGVQVGRCEALPLPARDHGVCVLERPGSSGLRETLLPMGIASLLTCDFVLFSHASVACIAVDCLLLLLHDMKTNVLPVPCRH